LLRRLQANFVAEGPKARSEAELFSNFGPIGWSERALQALDLAPPNKVSSNVEKELCSALLLPFLKKGSNSAEGCEATDLELPKLSLSC
jgi:hypothetical protein